MKKILPVTILITSYNRKNLLKRCVELINERTFFPFRIIVVDNNSIDGSQGLLKEMKVQGKIWDYVFMSENVGQCKALGRGFDVVEEWENNNERMHRPSNDFIVTSQEDCFPPMLGQDNCWLTQMIKLLEENEPEYGGLCMRIQRMPRTDIDESKNIIPGFKNFPSVFRLMRRSDLRKIEGNKFGELKKWESNITGENYKNIIRKKFGFTCHIFADHAGFMLENKGFPDRIDTFTVAANKLNERNEKPYPDIDPLTNVPIKSNHSFDNVEINKIKEYEEVIKNGIKEPEITIIITTCKRYDGLLRILNSIKKNTIDIDYKLLVVADNDDTEAYNYCLENNIPCILSSWNRDFTAQANLAAYACKTPYFCKFDDDMEVVDKDWLSRGLKIFKEKFTDGIGLMLFKDGIQNGRIFTCGISSKKFIYHMGSHLFYPEYKHYKGDRELTEMARNLNLYHYEDSINIIHYHPTNKNPEHVNEKDETYKTSERLINQDRILRNKRNEDHDLLIKKNYYDYF